VTLPKQNRPLVRDGRLQAKKKRTDRSYLRPAPTQTAVERAPVEEAEQPDASDVVRAAARAAVEPEAALTPAEPRPAPKAAPRTEAVPLKRTPSGKLPTAVRAIQQQGVRKRREFDVKALALRDTRYAIHEIRRIAILATMVVITLVVLTYVLR
jgi:hypothetical protein